MTHWIPLKVFGKGQVTLPKAFRDKNSTDYYLAEEVPEGLLIRPLSESRYYEASDEHFGLHFPTGISTSSLAKKLKAANEKLC